MTIHNVDATPEEVKTNRRCLDHLKQWLCFFRHTAAVERETLGLLGNEQTQSHYTLALDIDETLVYSDSIKPSAYDIELEFVLNDGSLVIYASKRPYLKEFMKVAGELFDVVLFTASLKEYASKIVASFQDLQIARLCLSREDCDFTEGCYVKDLKKIGKDLTDVVIIDVIAMQNTQLACALQPQNLLPIKTWRGSPHDTQLLEYIPLLRRMAASPRLLECVQELRRSIVIED
jgi:Dullard-like phosphatase family protein